MTPMPSNSQLLQNQLFLQQFVQECEAALQDLNSACSIEMLDAATSNCSLIGFFISWSSNGKNHAVVSRIDRLQQQAFKINEMLSRAGIFRNRMVCPLNTNFNGSRIRHAKENEHSFLGNLLTNWHYSSIASHGTLNELSMASTQIQQVRDQAMQMQGILNSIAINACY